MNNYSQPFVSGSLMMPDENGATVPPLMYDREVLIQSEAVGEAGETQLKVMYCSDMNVPVTSCPSNMLVNNTQPFYSIQLARWNAKMLDLPSGENLLEWYDTLSDEQCIDRGFNRTFTSEIRYGDFSETAEVLRNGRNTPPMVEDNRATKLWDYRDPQLSGNPGNSNFDFEDGHYRVRTFIRPAKMAYVAPNKTGDQTDFSVRRPWTWNDVWPESRWMSQVIRGANAARKWQMVIYAFEDIQVRLSVDIIHGLYSDELGIQNMNESFVNTLNVMTYYPSRARWGTNDTYFAILEKAYVSNNIAFMPLNLIPVQSNSMYAGWDAAFVGLGIVTDEEYTISSLSEVDAFAQYVQPASFWGDRAVYNTSYLPFISNCAGFDRVIPTFRLFEDEEHCDLVDRWDPEYTEYKAFDFWMHVISVCLDFLDQ